MQQLSEAPVAEREYIPTNQAGDGIKDETEATPDTALVVKQTFGEAKPRYYVMMVGGGVPTRPHGSRYYAEQEAKRLAGQYPDTTFHVLKVKSSFEARTEELKQIEARMKLKIGQRVRVVPTHFRNKNEIGEITGFTPVGAVTVLLESGKTFAFAATSLITDESVGTAEQVPDGISGEGMGG